MGFRTLQYSVAHVDYLIASLYPLFGRSSESYVSRSIIVVSSGIVQLSRSVRQKEMGKKISLIAFFRPVIITRAKSVLSFESSSQGTLVCLCAPRSSLSLSLSLKHKLQRLYEASFEKFIIRFIEGCACKCIGCRR
jgi:hypothetical protein